MKPINEIRYRMIPRAPDDVDGMIFYLRSEITPEVDDCLNNDRTRSYWLARELRAFLADDITVMEPIETWSDLAYLTALDTVSPQGKLAAKTLCALYWLSSCAQNIRDHGADKDEPPFHQWDDWKRLRTALVELGAWFLSYEQHEDEHRADRADRTIAVLKPEAERGKKFNQKKRLGAITPVNRYLLQMDEDHPGKTAKELARIIRADNSPSCPFETDCDDDVLKTTAATVNLEERIKTARTRQRARQRKIAASDQSTLTNSKGHIR